MEESAVDFRNVRKPPPATPQWDPWKPNVALKFIKGQAAAALDVLRKELDSDQTTPLEVMLKCMRLANERIDQMLNQIVEHAYLIAAEVAKKYPPPADWRDPPKLTNSIKYGLYKTEYEALRKRHLRLQIAYAQLGSVDQFVQDGFRLVAGLKTTMEQASFFASRAAPYMHPTLNKVQIEDATRRPEDEPRNAIELRIVDSNGDGEVVRSYMDLGEDDGRTGEG